jgi:rRNA-processing protein FCF1
LLNSYLGRVLDTAVPTVMASRYGRYMHLRRGATVTHAIEVLQERISASQGPTGSATDDAALKRNLYLNWVADTEAMLQEVFTDAGIEDPILGRGYWHICSIPPFDHALMNRLVREELRFQCGFPAIPGDAGGRLGEVRARLQALARLGDRPGRICVPDTNALLHYTRFDQLPWAERLRVEIARLVIPIVVVDELDAKKYARREEFQQRARELLTLIDRYVTASPPDGYSRTGPKVTVEVLPDEAGHHRAASNDQEILDRCELLQQATGNPVTLITGDSGMRISAQSRSIEVFKLSEDDLLPRHRQEPAPA